MNVFIIISNYFAGLLLLIVLGTQWYMWFENNRYITAILDGVTFADGASTLPCTSQKMAVYLAWKRARWWKHVFDGFTKMFSFIAIATVFSGAMKHFLGHSFDEFQVYMNSREDGLYFAVALHSISLIYFIYIIHNAKELQALIGILQQTPAQATPGH